MAFFLLNCQKKCGTKNKTNKQTNKQASKHRQWQSLITVK